MRIASVGLLLLLAACGERDAERAVAATFTDSTAARFQSVERHGEFVCGEVNPGGRAGYTRFVFEEATERVNVAPPKSYSAAELDGFDRTCRMLGGAGTAFDRQACARATDARRDADRAATFALIWQQACQR